MQSLPTFAVYGIAHSFPLGNVDRDFSFTEDYTRRYFSYLSSTFREHLLMPVFYSNLILVVFSDSLCFPILDPAELSGY